MRAFSRLEMENNLGLVESRAGGVYKLLIYLTPQQDTRSSWQDQAFIRAGSGKIRQDTLMRLHIRVRLLPLKNVSDMNNVPGMI